MPLAANAPANNPAPANAPATPNRPAFDAPDLLAWLDQATTDALDTLPFGLVVMAREGTVLHYNAAEAALTGLTPARVIGRDFFTAVAPCTNNFMVAHRLLQAPAIDAEIDYVFTFRLAPMDVRLRLLKAADAARMYLAVRRRDGS